MIEPPNGHAFGFPKWFDGDVEALGRHGPAAWLLEKGYPQEWIDLFPKAFPAASSGRKRVVNASRNFRHGGGSKLNPMGQEIPMAAAYVCARSSIPMARELGVRLKGLREREGLTAHDIARRVKMRDQDIVRFEEEGQIDGEQLVKLISMISANRSLEGAFTELSRTKRR